MLSVAKNNRNARNRRYIKNLESNAERRKRKLIEAAKNRRTRHEDKTGYDALGDAEKTEISIQPSASTSSNIEAFMNYTFKQNDHEKAREMSRQTVWSRTPPAVVLGYNLAGIGNPTPNKDNILARSFYLTLGFGLPIYETNADGERVGISGWNIDPIVSKYHQKRWFELNPHKQEEESERSLSAAMQRFAEKMQDAVDICLQGMFECESIKSDDKMKLVATAKRIHKNDEEAVMVEAFEEFTENANTAMKGSVSTGNLRRAMITARYYDLEHMEHGTELSSEQLAAEAEKQIDKEYDEDALTEMAENMFTITLGCKVWEEPADLRNEKNFDLKGTLRDAILAKVNERHADAKSAALGKLKIDPEWRGKSDDDIDREAVKIAERVVWQYLISQEGFNYKKPVYTNHEGKQIADTTNGDIFVHPTGVDSGALVRVSFAVDPYSQKGGPHYGVRTKLSVRQVIIVDGGQAPRNYRRQELQNFGRYGKAEGTQAPRGPGEINDARDGFGTHETPVGDDETDDGEKALQKEVSSSSSSAAASSYTIDSDDGGQFFDPEGGLMRDD